MKKNLEWSGVFDVKKKKKQANLKFIIAKKNVLEYSSKDNANYEIQDAIEVKVLTQEDKLLLQGSFENSSDPKELENNTIDFVQNIIYKISRKKGTLGSAIIYSAQKDSMPKESLLQIPMIDINKLLFLIQSIIFYPDGHPMKKALSIQLVVPQGLE